MSSLGSTLSGQPSAGRAGLPRFTAGLRELTAAVQAEARLTPAGRRAAESAWASILATQRQVASLIQRHPEISTTSVDRPIFITGAHRSGTTLLQRLLACHPGVHAPALWEQLAPASQADQPELVQRARQYVDAYYQRAPALPSIHELDPHQPDECHRLLGVSFRSEIYELRYRVPSYGAWLRAQDPIVAYRYHRTLLRCLTWRRPGGRPVLKCPFHMSHLDTLAAVYPDAVVVRLHRDPAQTVPSGCSLIATIRRAWSDRVDPVEIGRFWLSRTETLLHRLSQDSGPAPLPVLDVRYPDLVNDPLATAITVCAFAGIPTDDRAKQLMARFLADNPSRRHGEHRYQPADFGLRGSDLADRFAVYRAAFDL